jgi:glycine dehydrogenase
MHAEHLSHPLGELEQRDEFIARHIGPDAADIAAMLAAIGVIRSHADREDGASGDPPATPAAACRPPCREHEALAALKAIAAKNVVKKSLIGMGYYDTLTPKVILRNVLENPGWYTAYTPYQAEIAQGRLEALLNYQQMVLDLTGMQLANASLLDEATAAAEAMTMARRISKSKSNVFFVDAHCFPQTIDVVKTRAGLFGYELVIGAAADAAQHDAFGALLQYPDARGEVDDLTATIAALKAKGTVTAVASDLMALVLLKSPGVMGADIALGSSQRFGVPMGFGGPHAAFFATSERAQAHGAGPHHRRLDRCARQKGAAHGAADARAAHPPREGQLQHLHLASAAGQHRRHVCGVSRPAGAKTIASPHPPPRRHPRPGREAGADSSKVPQTQSAALVRHLQGQTGRSARLQPAPRR